MKRLLLLLLCVLLVIPITAHAQNDTTCVFYFYGITCPHCARVHPFLEELQTRYPNVKIVQLETQANYSNALLLQKYLDYYKVFDEKERGVPAAFISNISLIGDAPIIDNLEKIIKENPDAECPVIESEDNSKALSFITIIGAAVVDSINPCAIAVLLIILMSLLMLGKKKALFSGFMFILAIFIIYFLFGIGLFSAFHFLIAPMSIAKSILTYVIGAVAIIIGLLNIKDYFWYGAGGFVMEIPMRWRPKMKMLLHKATSPLSAFILGFIVSAFELPCTGGPYFFATAYLSDKVSMLVAVPILLLYNLFFVLPLIIINLLVYYGVTTIEKTEGWKEHHIRMLHLIAGIIMLVLGVLVFFGIL